MSVRVFTRFCAELFAVPVYGCVCGCVCFAVAIVRALSCHHLHLWAVTVSACVSVAVRALL